MPIDARNELDSSVRSAAHELESRGLPSPEVLFLLGTGTDDLTPLFDEPIEVSFADLPGTPVAWRRSRLVAGRIAGARIWSCADAPDPDPVPWARAWPIWLSRAAGAGSCMVTAAGSNLHSSDADLPDEGFLFVQDHLVLDGSSPLRGLASSNLGPLFPDQGSVHDTALRSELLRDGKRLGLPCAEGVLACVPGPALETPAERTYLARTGAHASAQDLGSVFHAMAHSGLSGVTIVALLGSSTARVEDLIEASGRLAPGLAELLGAAMKPLATSARAEREEDL